MSVVTDLNIVPICDFPNPAGEILLLDFTLPLIITPDPYHDHQYHIVPKMWICEGNIFHREKLHGKYLMVDRDKLLATNLSSYDFVIKGYAEEVSEEEIQDILKQGYVLATSASLIDPHAKERGHFKIYQPSC